MEVIKGTLGEEGKGPWILVALYQTGLILRARKRFANLAKQDPGRVRQSS